MKYLAGALTFLFATALLVFGSYEIWRQHRANTLFVPVDAQITSAHLTRHSHNKGADSYSPDITYQYRYRDHLYTSSTVVPFGANGGLAWAEQIISQFKPPAARIARNGLPEATAYLDPQNPSEAILIRQYDSTPYLIAHAGLLGVGIGLGLLTGIVAGGRKQMAAVALDDSTWRLLLPTENLWRQFIHAALWTGWVAIAAWVPLMHWYVVARQVGAYGVEFGLVALGVSAGFAAVAYRRWSVTRQLSDARLRVNPAPMQRGQPLALELEADAYRPLTVLAATAKVRCVEHYRERCGNKTTTGTRTRFESEVPFSQAAKFDAGQAMQFKAEFLCDASNPPTTDISALKAYPYYAWEIRVHLQFQNAPDYRATFPLEVD